MKSDPEIHLLLQEVSSLLKEDDLEEYSHIENLRKNCRNLYKAFKDCTSVYKDQPGVGTLAEHLLTQDASLSESLPARASTGRNWTMATFDLFGRLCRLTGDTKTYIPSERLY